MAKNCCESILCFFLFFIISFSAISVSAQTCDKTAGTFKPNSTYDNNRRLIFSTLASNVTAKDGYFNGSIGLGPDRVYAMGMCAPGAEPDVCSQCIQSASDSLLQSCSNQTDAYSWSGTETLCLVRYSSKSFFGLLVLEPYNVLYNFNDIRKEIQKDFDSVWDGLMFRMIGRTSSSVLLLRLLLHKILVISVAENMTKTTTSDKKIRRSKRQQGLDVTPLEVKTAKRAKKLAESVADEPQQVYEPEAEQPEQQQVSEPEAEEEADPAVQQNGVEGEEEEHEAEQHDTACEQNGEEHEAEQHDNSPEECVTDHSKTKKRTRGPTRMSKLAKSNGDKVDVEFNIIGNHVGKGSVTLSTFMGVLVREHVSVLLEDWRYLDAKIKDTMWEQLQGTFNLTEDWQKNSLLMQMGNTWRSHKSRLLKKVRLAKTKGEIRALKPINIHSESAWFKWVKTRTGKAFEERSEVYRAMRKSQIPQTSSRKGFNRLEDEMKKKAPDPSKITRSKVWIAGHTHADGRPVKPEFQEKIEQIKSLDSEIGSNSNVSHKEDAVSQILGKDKSGRIRGMGRGVTATKLAYLQARDAHVQKIEAEQAELKSEVADLRQLVRDLTKGKRDDGANSDTTDEPRCQLLDWSVDGDVVVADGKLCSVEPSYKIGRMPIGPNGSAVIVTFVSDKNASLWRPTSTINKLGQTVGTKIAWPFDKLIVDSMDSSTGNKGPDASAITTKEDRVQLVDWILGGEVIAEAHMISKDPEQLVNQIPLGPNAAMVKIVKVFNKEASLWRPPSEDIFVMGDALLVNIAWPLSKLSKCNGQRMEDAESESEGRGQTSSKGARTSGSKEVEPTKESSPKSGASNSSNNSNLAKKKCFLIDCFGSGEKVAEAKVLSTNPTDTVHCHPLGPNASKVWVDLLLVGTAKVWRQTSEYQIIADALGTTIAWPNANIVYM